MQVFDFWGALFGNLFGAGIGILIFFVMAFLIYFYSNKRQTGPLHLRGKNMRPFMYTLTIVTIGLMLGFLYVYNVGREATTIVNIQVAAAALGLGILFSLAAFIKLYRGSL